MSIASDAPTEYRIKLEEDPMTKAKISQNLSLRAASEFIGLTNRLLAALSTCGGNRLVGEKYIGITPLQSIAGLIQVKAPSPLSL